MYLQKALIYRFGIAIPSSIMMNYLYFCNIYSSIEYTVIINSVSTVTHYYFDKIYDYYIIKKCV